MGGNLMYFLKIEILRSCISQRNVLIPEALVGWLVIQMTRAE